MIGPTRFLDNKYRSWYQAITSNASSRNKSRELEGHHVYPGCFGGTKECIVYLTFREHFLCHWLLTKFTVGRARMKMGYAMTSMVAKTDKHSREPRSWQYDVARRKSIGFKHSEASLEKMRDAKRGNTWNRGRPLSEAAKEKLRKPRPHMVGKSSRPHTEETKARLREMALQRYARKQ